MQIMTGAKRELLYWDPVSGKHCSYEETLRAAKELNEVPLLAQTLCTAELLTLLLAALLRNAPILLVPNSIAVESVQELVNGPPLPSPPTRAGAGGEGWLAQIRASRARVGLLSSGSTGRPKLVWHAVASLTRAVRVGPQHADDVWGLAYHPAHFAGLQVFFQALLNQNPLIRLFNLPPDTIHDAIDAHHISHLSATPTFFKLLCTARDRTHPSVKRITTGGEPLPGALAETIQQTFPHAKLNNIYASTEAGTLLVAHGDGFSIPAELADRVQIVDGELAVHRSLLADSLQHDASLPTDSSGDYFLTGDLVEPLPDAPGVFRIAARRSDTINVGGYKVNPLEIEQALLAMEEIAEARVYGKANSVTGQLVCCDVVLHAGRTLPVRELRGRLAERFTPYQIPGLVNYVPTIAMTYSGKKVRSP
jgi:acyl-coenzyme A synthetase/AMP-(fatty) acid ligase